MPKKIGPWIRLVWKKCPVSSVQSNIIRVLNFQPKPKLQKASPSNYLRIKPEQTPDKLYFNGKFKPTLNVP